MLSSSFAVAVSVNPEPWLSVLHRVSLTNIDGFEGLGPARGQVARCKIVRPSAQRTKHGRAGGNILGVLLQRAIAVFAKKCHAAVLLS